MGWQTTNPGGTYTSVASANKTYNKYQVVITVSMARLTNNNIAFKFVQNTYQGSTSTFVPPNYMDFRLIIAGTTYNHQETWGANGPGKFVTSKTLYWTGNANKDASIKVMVGAHDDGSAFSHQVYIEKTTSGPAYTSQYTLSFNGNGNNSGSTASQTKTWNTTIYLPANGFQKTGYNFVGWNTNSAGTGTTYQPGASYTITANVTLYAKWQQITYTVSYNGNGEDSGTTEPQTKNWGEALTLRQNAYSKTNYTFQHWNTAADDSGTSYPGGGSYNENAAVTLYAIWKKNNIPVFIRDGNDIIQIEKAFINDGGTIKECTVYQNLGGTIVEYV